MAVNLPSSDLPSSAPKLSSWADQNVSRETFWFRLMQISFPPHIFFIKALILERIDCFFSFPTLLSFTRLL